MIKQQIEYLINTPEAQECYPKYLNVLSSKRYKKILTLDCESSSNVINIYIQNTSNDQYYASRLAAFFISQGFAVKKPHYGPQYSNLNTKLHVAPECKSFASAIIEIHPDATQEERSKTNAWVEQNQEVQSWLDHNTTVKSDEGKTRIANKAQNSKDTTTIREQFRALAQRKAEITYIVSSTRFFSKNKYKEITEERYVSKSEEEKLLLYEANNKLCKITSIRFTHQEGNLDIFLSKKSHVTRTKPETSSGAENLTVAMQDNTVGTGSNSSQEEENNLDEIIVAAGMCCPTILDQASAENAENECKAQNEDTLIQRITWV
jgi:hypothetical protein